MQSLSLPEIGRHHKSDNKNPFAWQTYADFASKAEKKNPDVAFDRKKMDQAFEFTARQLLSPGQGRNRSSFKDLDKMMARVGVSFV